jgi:hypothetical protein
VRTLESFKKQQQYEGWHEPKPRHWQNYARAKRKTTREDQDQDQVIVKVQPRFKHEKDKLIKKEDAVLSRKHYMRVHTFKLTIK